MKPSHLLEVLKIGIPKQRSFLLVGGPGIGKTDIGKQAAIAVNYECQIFHPVTSDPTDLKGMPWIYVNKESNAPTAEFIPFGDLKRLLDSTVPTLAFLDDLGQAPPLVQAAAMQLLWGGTINGYKVPDHVTWLAATNRRQDRAAVTGILEPVKSRFFSIIHLETDVEDWLNRANLIGVPPVVRAFIRWRPELLNNFEPNADMKNSPVPRTIVFLGELYQDNYPAEVQCELFTGTVGEGFALEFIAFEQIWSKLPDPRIVVNDPDSIDIPDDPATLYALCGAVASIANDQNMDNIVKFAYRLADGSNFDDETAKSEFGVILIRDSIKHDPEVQNTRGFIEWTSKNTEVMI